VSRAERESAARSDVAGVKSPARAEDAAPGVHGALAQPGGDPRQSLSPPALNILQAAQRVLVEKGFSGLTLRAIAAESGENSAMVQYYFGNKEGLVKAMIDSVFRDDQQDAAAAMSSVASDDWLPRFVDGLRTISGSRSFRVFFDILPYALRNEGLRSRMARAYDSYRRIKRDWLLPDDDADAGTDVVEAAADATPPARSPEEDAMAGVAELMTAVVDGLAIQEAIDDDFDMRRAYAVLEFMLQRSLPELLESGLPGEAVAGR
jgi:AcrR family transcriptional regulator